MAIRVVIDRDECISCGNCWEDCPQCFEENPDDGFSQIVETYRSSDQLGVGEAPPELEDCCRQAETDCPVQIIHLG